jgi:5-methylcytosine-specific restriction endonuclease McrA
MDVTNAEYRRANPEYFAAYRTANRAKVRSRALAWYHANPEQAKARRSAHPERQAAYSGRHRSRRIGAPGNGVTAAQWERVLSAALGLCAWCNERKPLTMDHVEPLCLGGAHDVSNVVAACADCNTSKGRKPLVIWLALRAA